MSDPEPTPIEPVPEQETGDETEQETGDETEQETEPTELPSTVEPSDAPPDSSALMEERGKKFDLLNKHVAKRVGEILGDDADMAAMCPLCTYYGMPGWIPQVPPPLELQTALYAYIGQHAPAAYKPDGYSRECDKCGGLGEVLTGSQVAGQDRLPCIDCLGRGWLAVGNERAQGGASLRNGSAVPATPGAVADATIAPAPVEDDPEVARLRDAGYIVVGPVSTL